MSTPVLSLGRPAFAGFALLAFAWAMTAPAQAAELTVVNAHVPTPPTGASSAVAYMTLRNPSATPVNLVSAYSTEFGRAALMTVRDGRMMDVETLSVPAGAGLELTASGDHVMLYDPVGPLKSGDFVRVFLETDAGDLILVQAEVKDGTATMAPMIKHGAGAEDAHGHHHRH